MTLWTDLLGARVTWVDVGGVLTRVVVAGETGPVVVLLHGRGGRLEAWRHTVAPLAAAGRQVIAFDLLGHGLTGRHTGGYGIEELTGHAVATLEALGLIDATLVGQSIGGWVAVEVALRRPELVRALALMKPAGFQSEAERMADPKVAAAFERGGRAFATPTTEAVRDRLRGLFADPAAIDDELVAVRQALYAPEEARAVHRAVRAADNGALLLTAQRLAALDVPVLIVHGAQANTPRDVVAAAATAAHARLVELPDTKQWPQYEAPGAVNELLIDFTTNEGI